MNVVEKIPTALKNKNKEDVYLIKLNLADIFFSLFIVFFSVLNVRMVELLLLLLLYLAHYNLNIDFMREIDEKKLK